ncbi:MAG: hypothetical protein BWY72_01129 [Bacteroidetes bacterium ADurb.Bin416]|nr:MAG: hypothetical protein BWY72_01129 [Bacteroidetes bacterium ADurb.Bin416]
MVGVTQQIGPFKSEIDQLIDDGLIVLFVIVVSPVDVSLEHGFTQVPAFGVLQERYQAGLMQGKHPFSFQSFFFGCFSGSVDATLG